jgi:hypothetical protein
MDQELKSSPCPRNSEIKRFKTKKKKEEPVKR